MFILSHFLNNYRFLGFFSILRHTFFVAVSAACTVRQTCFGFKFAPLALFSERPLIPVGAVGVLERAHTGCS